MIADLGLKKKSLWHNIETDSRVFSVLSPFALIKSAISHEIV